MKTGLLKKAVELSTKTGYIFVATADKTGMAHVGVAGKMSLVDQDSLSVTEWFCPGTISNLQNNSNISIVVWDKTCDVGCQMLGNLAGFEDIGVLDGYSPELKSQPPMPQVQRRLLVKVQKIMDFKLAPHSDLAYENT